MIQEEVIKRRDDAGHYKGEGWCMRTCKREGWYGRRVL